MNIEQAVSAAVAGLQLGNTFTFDDLLRSVQDQRHRRLRVIELADLDTHDGLCALWLATDTDDLVLHARTDSTLHRQQFVLHEFAHMILGHCEGDDCTVANCRSRQDADIRAYPYAVTNLHRLEYILAVVRYGHSRPIIVVG